MGLDTECDLTFEAAGEARIAAVIRDFRERLLAEHLDVMPAAVREQNLDALLKELAELERE